MNKNFKENNASKIEEYTYIEALLENVDLIINKVEKLEKKEKQKNTIIIGIVVIQILLIIFVLLSL